MKGIMFKEDLFRKVLSGEKTQTRRIIPMSQPVNWAPDKWELFGAHLHDGSFAMVLTEPKDDVPGVEIRPSYKKGDLLYLKEPYAYGWTHATNDQDLHFKYTATEKELEIFKGDWQNKMFMPAKYAREFIKITKVRVERIADISEKDCVAEGCPGIPCHCNGGGLYCVDCMNTRWQYDPKYIFRLLWNDINCKWKRIGDNFFAFPFDRQHLELKNADRRDRHVIPNPWVFCYDFERCDREGNAIGETAKTGVV